MSENYSKRTDPDFLTMVMLTMAVASVVLIVIRLAYTLTLYAPGPVVVASYLLSFILLTLSGALLFQKPWSLFPLSLAGKGYFLLAIVLLLVRAQNLTDPGWLSTALSSLYLATLNYLNRIRTYIGQEKVSGTLFAARAATGILLVTTCLTLYVVLISNIFPDYAYRSYSHDYRELVKEIDTGGYPAYTWSERWKVAVPEQYRTLGREIGMGIWTNSQGDRVLVSEGVWSEQVEEYSFMGYTEPYDVDKAVWKAGLGQPFLLVLKMSMTDEASKAYFMESPAVKSVIILKHAQLASQSLWNATANIYTAYDRPYTIESAGASLRDALLPIQMTLHRLQEGS
jgi:hypothetical protein